jgi:hypothetical protein
MTAAGRRPRSTRRGRTDAGPGSVCITGERRKQSRTAGKVRVSYQGNRPTGCHFLKSDGNPYAAITDYLNVSFPFTVSTKTSATFV